MTVPYTFATATSSIPLSQLDSNFATAITLGNTAVYLGNTTTSIGNLTLTNTTISSVAVTFPNSYLSNSSVTIGSTSVSLGGTATSIAGLTLTSGAFNGTLGATTPSTAVVTSLTDSGLTSGRVNYNGTGGLLVDSANLTFDGTTLTANKVTSTNDASISGLTVGKGGGSDANSTAVGAGAIGGTNTSGYTHAFGVNALNAITSGSSNNAFGWGSLQNTTTGGGNSAFGHAANRLNTTGAFNTALGYNALYSNTTASNNTAVGYQAGYSNTTAGNNTNLGYAAGYTNSTGVNNLYVGYGSGYAATGGGNCFVGYASGTLVTSGTNNTILGSYSGNQGGLDIRTASNYIVLSDGAGNPRGVFDSTGSFYTGGYSSGLAGAGGIASITNGASSQCYTAWNKATSGTIYYAYFGAGATFSGTGSITYNGTTTLYNATSDQRLKENIVDAGSGLDKLANIKIRAFDWIKSKQHTDFGVIAQEIYEIAPDSVTMGVDKDDGSIDKPWQVDTSTLVPAMIKAIQELKAEFDAYKATHP